MLSLVIDKHKQSDERPRVLDCPRSGLGGGNSESRRLCFCLSIDSKNIWQEDSCVALLKRNVRVLVRL
jgi:hypothetical protein